ncbi:receptor-like serine/threonine-protein kinase At2g45590 [Andrographis paniculata]|uniref:receptor-like serine/threonine-protein kinase At2g45590 n=1 Tax=Andrographis paniculata TaxID=175694 RepID=UPI0021E6E047|nr:receptor-like serine/threonine-protein kinase At2g45590 [Andrographis paniculata]
MPSRRLLSPPSPHHHQTNRLILPLVGGLSAAISFIIIIIILAVIYLRRNRRKRTAPSASDTDSRKPPYRVSYSVLRRATSNFSPSLRLGQGGFGCVYRGELKSGNRFSYLPIFTAAQFAVKLLDSGSLQGEREFQNELLFASKIDCKYIVSVLGFSISSNPNKRRMLLVYELMENGSLQDCLFHENIVELRSWNKRFSIALNIARGLEYLHHYCDPPIIHGDIKPSNILLDGNFSAKLGDFGLARFKIEDLKKEGLMEDIGSVIETESVLTTSCFDEAVSVSVDVDISDSPETRTEASPLSPETPSPAALPITVAAMISMPSPRDRLDNGSVSEGNADDLCVDGGGESKNNGKKTTKKRKDYVMEWLGNEIKNERPTIGSSLQSQIISGKDEKRRKKRRQSDWWMSMDDDNGELEQRKKKKSMTKKKTKSKEIQGSITDDNEKTWRSRDNALFSDDGDGKTKQSRSRGSMEWWFDGFSGELWRAWKSSHDGNPISGEIPRSGSTPSTRGTVCYIAPEHCSSGDASEKCDVYSFGVVLLVLVARRRPLQVTGSPMVEFRRANLLAWARNLARAGKLDGLIDPGVECLEKEQAMVCITVALLCLQKSPSRRPAMKEVVQMLTGDLPLPELPVELSPAARFPVRTQKRVK